MIDFDKLKHEWKTVAWGILCIIVEAWDVILASQYDLVEPLFSPEHQWIVRLAIPLGFFLLRRWKSAVEEEQIEGHP